MQRITLVTRASDEYELLDSGEEAKLERYGPIVLARPDPQALWEKRLSTQAWQRADAQYSRVGGEGEWKTRSGFPEQWPIEFGGLRMYIRATSFKHTGLFPEQLSNWEWVQGIIRKNRSLQSVERGSAAKVITPSILNLFAYTGGATFAAAQAGATVTHVDSSKVAVAWARENAELSGLSDKPIRWITEDVLTFVKREIKRGNRYDAIIMDPPAFGHGPKNELWKIEEDLLVLVKLCEELLSPEPLFILVSGYAAGYSPLALAYNLERFEKKFGGAIEFGDLTIAEKGSAGQNGRLLPCGIFGRWSH